MRIKTLLNILGALLSILGITMVVPIFISLGYGEPDWEGFLISSIICVIVGFPTWFITRHNQSLTNRDGFAIVTFSWVLAGIAGSFPFYFSGAIPNVTDAFFESMSGVTTTGASILNNIESLPHGVLYWRSFIQWIGGMGIIVFYIAVLPLLGVGGVQLFKAEVPGPVADKIKPRVRETAKVLWIVYVGITFAEIIALSVAGMSIFDAVCHGFTTMPTGGFSTKNTSIGYFESSIIHYIIIFFMFLAGVNFSLHFRAIHGDIKTYIKDKEFLAYLGGVLIVTLVVFSAVSFQGDSLNALNFRDSLFTTISILTTTGYSSADYELWPAFVQLILLALMFVGGMGGSTGGGMKVIRVMLLLKYAGHETRRMLHARALIPIRIGKQLIKEDVVRNTLGFFLFFMSAFILSTIVLASMGLDISSAIGAAASAMGNIGPGLGEFGPTDNYALLSPPGKWILTFCMLLGRLEIFTVMVLFSRTFWK
ncbi:MAG: TrkH family potassium uptake protein [Candidatus Neomarinimicrobiota bacterium]|nr:TrkH family potassium uptake protein [Candidatus Neomarinimicrobiota bacterium]